ncbi:MAG TPA: ABC transporter permease, partial [Enterococcus sp.]|nr:ABC transporter permease [Enterococcus sp.]
MSSPVKVNPQRFHKDQLKIHVLLVFVSLIMGLPVIFI